MFGIDTWGLDVVLWFETIRTPLVVAIALVAHRLGRFIPYMLLLPVFYWCVDRRFGARLGAWFVAGVYVNSALKVIFGMPRPYFDPANGVANLVEDVGNGLPSGHAQNATNYWGMVATYVRRRWMWAVVALYAAVMGTSRVVLGVHYPQDVLAGWLIGAAWVGFYLGIDRSLTEWLKGISLWGQLALSAAIGFGVLALLLAEDGATFGGALLGLGAGLSLAGRRAAFDAGGVWWRRVVRYGIGALGLLVLQFGLGAAFEGLEPALAFRFVRYALIGLWVGFGSAWVFLRTGLAAPENA